MSIDITTSLFLMLGGWLGSVIGITVWAIRLEGKVALITQRADQLEDKLKEHATIGTDIATIKAQLENLKQLFERFLPKGRSGLRDLADS